MASRIPFPNRFYAAVGFAANPPLGARAVSDETRLLLYALYQQATAGPCRAPKPWGWNAIESAKWSSWTQLGDMARIDAMKMYVSTMEEENDDWFTLFTDGGDPARVAEVLEAAAEAVSVAGEESELAALRDRERESSERRAKASANQNRSHPAVDRIDGEEGRWTTITANIKGKAPRGRYSHTLSSVGDDVFVIGGNAGGRRLADVSALNVATMNWRKINATVASEGNGITSFPARSGHAAVAWGTKIVVVGGYHADDALKKSATAAAREQTGETLASPRCDVWVLDVETSEWRRLELGSDAPPARGGHTATLVRGEAGAKIVVFGGEDRRGRLLDEVHVIDLAKQAWVTPEITGMSPTARTGHVAASFGAGSRAVTDVYVFGGVSAGGAGEVSGELFVLDTVSMTWRELSPAGVAPVPRAGAAGAVIGETWFVAGGGGADGGRRDTVALRVDPASGELEWAAAAEVEAGSTLASEGAGVVSVGGGAALFAFGGYDGAKYSADTHVLKRPAAGSLAMTKTKMLSPVKQKEWVSAADTEQKRGARSLNASTPRQSDALTTSGDLESTRRELAVTRRLLTEERSKSSQLESQLADTRVQLEYALRNARGSARSSPVTSPKDRENETPSPPVKNRGVWGFLTGDAPESTKTATAA